MFVHLNIVFLFVLGCGVGSSHTDPVATTENSEKAQPSTTETLMADVLNLERDPLGFDDSSDSFSSSGRVVRQVFEDSRGSLWLAGEGGLFRHDGRSLKQFDIKDQFGQGVTVKEVTEDNDGVIWCGSTGGVTRIEGETVTTFSEQDGLIFDDVWSITAAKNGLIWIGTLQGACYFDGEEFTDFPIPPAEPDRTRGITSARIVHCIMQDSQEQIWFGTNGGAYVYDGDSLSNFSTKDGLNDNAIFRLLEDDRGQIWFGTTHGGVCRHDGEAFFNVSKEAGIAGEEVWALHEDQQKQVWFSVKGQGVFCCNGESSEVSFVGASGPAARGIMCLFEDSRRRLWCGGAAGLFFFDGTTFRRRVGSSPIGDGPKDQ